MREDRRGKRLEPTGKALRSALEELCGRDVRKYVETKNAQLKTLGFELSAYEFKMALHCATREELIEVFLGIKQNVPVSNFSALFEKQFDIKPPLDNAINALVTFNPAPMDECNIIYRRERLSKPSIFVGTLVFVPNHISGADRIDGLFRTEFFNIQFKVNPLETTFEINAWATDKKKSISEWRNIFDLWLGLAVGTGNISIQTRRIPSVLINIPLHQPNDAMDQQLLSY